MSIRKTPLQQAIIEAKEIEKVAYESARKALEETISPKIEQAVKESLMELENQSDIDDVADVVEEAVKIEVTTDGTISVTNDTSEETSNKEVENIEAINTETPNAEITNIETTNTENPMDENINLEEEIFEVEAGTAPAEVPAEVPTEAPVEVPTEAPMASITSSNPFEELNQKLDAILDKVGSASSEQSSEGEVEIVDDEITTAPQATTPSETPAATQAPVTEMEDEDVVYELEDENAFVRETDNSSFGDMEDMEEIEIVDEDLLDDQGTEEVDEMMGVSHSVQNREPNRLHKNAQGHHSPVFPLMKEGESKKIKAQQESKLDELKQENEGLKKTIKEYKESFVVLRKQINEVQVFNAKLAYANKLFITGGLKNEEKVRIAEEFDKVSTVEDAKKLYNNLLKEVSQSKAAKGSPEEKLKSVKPSIQPQAEPSQTLYESTEIKRMKQLAGILGEGK